MGALRLATSQAPLEALDRLALRSRRAASVICGLSARADVRRVRARLMLLLLELRCPLGGAPRQRWYVPGAVARLGAEGLRRAWMGYFGEEPPSLRSVRTHLAVLEDALLLMRSPGDWIPLFRKTEHREHRPRYADTLHVIDSDEQGAWWASEGAELLARNQDCRHNPTRWWRVFGAWRARAARLAREPLLPFETPASAAVLKPAAPPRERAIAQRALAGALSSLARVPRSPFELLHGLRAVGISVAGANSFRLAGSPERLRGAVALLSRALSRGDLVHNPAGWLVRAATHASVEELSAALEENQ